MLEVRHQSRVALVEARSFYNHDPALDTPITHDDLEAAILHLKQNSSGGPDLLSPHHRKHSCPLLKKCLCQAINYILELEAIPTCLMAGTITHIYKGANTLSFWETILRGITLTSVLAKTFEFIILDAGLLSLVPAPSSVLKASFPQLFERKKGLGPD